MSRKKKKKDPNFGLNVDDQFYKGIRVRLIPYHPDYYANKKAKRFELGDRKHGQNVWIPNAYLTDNGTIKEGANLDFVFTRAIVQNKFYYAYLDPSIFGYDPAKYGRSVPNEA